MTDLEWCIDYLLKVNNTNRRSIGLGFDIFRGLLNITMPINLSDEFYERQDRVLQDLLKGKNITSDSEFNNGLSVYNGDITLIKVDAIVNACNSQMLGCFVPNHRCVDNAIHSFAGLEVRRDMMELMNKQGHPEPNGMCKVTKGYNLPAKYIFHTVGPIYSGDKQDEIDLRNCYLSCLREADKMNLKSICFSSISTGIFGYPIIDASKIAIETSYNYLKTENKNIEKIIFDCFSERDYSVYNRQIKEIVR